ncbi:MAG: hypothetical protein Fur0010_06030 [Bdellovibrio sp.]
MMKHTLIAATLGLAFATAHADMKETYEGSTFKDVWSQVISDPYENPNNTISFSSLSKWFENKIKQSAERTLSDRSDILP